MLATSAWEGTVRRRVLKAGIERARVSVSASNADGGVLDVRLVRCWASLRWDSASVMVDAWRVWPLEFFFSRR